MPLLSKFSNISIGIWYGCPPPSLCLQRVLEISGILSRISGGILLYKRKIVRKIMWEHFGIKVWDHYEDIGGYPLHHVGLG